MKITGTMSPTSVMDTTIDDLLQQTLCILEREEADLFSQTAKHHLHQDTFKNRERKFSIASRQRKSFSRSVRFATTLEFARPTISRHDMSPTEIYACWWTAAENEAINTKATSLVQYTRQQGRSFVKKTVGRTLDRALKLAYEIESQEATKSQVAMTDALLADNLSLSSKHLREWMKHCNARRGLEKYFVDNPGFTDSVAVHRRTVLSILEQKCSVPIELGPILTQSSLPARIFARMKGIEDEQLVYDMTEHCVTSTGD
jgi:hypothetical protein